MWLLSTDNLNRPSRELEPLLGIIIDAVETLAEQRRWRLHPVGALDLLPAKIAERLKVAAESTADVDGLLVNIAVGYGGRREIADAVRALLTEHAGKGTTLEELAEVLDVEHIAEHLYTKGQPDPDLVIRTSGEQRLGGFLLWQSAQSEFYFCEAYWPDFRRVDFLRAVRAYAERERRFGVLRRQFGHRARMACRPVSPRRPDVRCGCRPWNRPYQEGEARERSRPLHHRRSALRPPAPVPVRAHQLADRGAGVRAPVTRGTRDISEAHVRPVSSPGLGPGPGACRAGPTSWTPRSCWPTRGR